MWPYLQLEGLSLTDDLLSLPFCYSQLSGGHGCISCSLWVVRPGGELWEQQVSGADIQVKTTFFFFAQARRCLTFTEPDSWFSVLQHGVQSAHTTCTHLQCSAHVCSAWVHDSGWVFYPPTSVSPSLTDPHILVPVVFWLVLKTCSVHNLLTDCYDTWGSIMTRK